MPLVHKDYNGLPIGLPEHLLYKILDDVTPEQAVAAFSVGPHTRKFIGNNEFWGRKFKLHFPYRYDATSRKENINWYDEFRSIYRDIYTGLSASERRLFSLVKEGHVASLRLAGMTLKSLVRRHPFGQTLLKEALRKGNQSVLDYFYELACASYRAEDDSSVDTTKIDEEGRTILYWALICRQSPATIKSLLERGSRLDERYFHTQVTPIHIVALEGYIEIVRALIEMQPDLLEWMDAYGATPLLSAATAGHAEVVDYLVDQGASLAAATHFPGGENKGNTALHWAAAIGHASVIHRLVRANANALAALNRARLRPLDLAVRQGRLSAVQALIESNPEMLEHLDAGVPSGLTPLFRATMLGHVNIADYLIGRGANVNVQVDNPGFRHHGMTPLDWAIKYSDSDAMRELLVKHGAISGFKKKIHRSGLSKDFRAKLRLNEYIHKRSKQPEYKKSFRLFGHTFNFGFSATKKLAAAEALRKVVFNGADRASLAQHKKVLNNGDLGAIYRRFRVR